MQTIPAGQIKVIYQKIMKFFGNAAKHMEVMIFVKYIQLVLGHTVFIVKCFTNLLWKFGASDFLSFFPFSPGLIHYFYFFRLELILARVTFLNIVILRDKKTGFCTDWKRRLTIQHSDVTMIIIICRRWLVRNNTILRWTYIPRWFILLFSKESYIWFLLKIE